MDGDDQFSIDSELDQKKKDDDVDTGEEETEPLNLGDEEEDYYDATDKDTSEEYDMSFYMDPNGDRAEAL